MRWHFENEVNLDDFALSTSPIETDAARELFEQTMTDVECALQQILDDPDNLRFGKLPRRLLFTLEEAQSAVRRILSEGRTVSQQQLRSANRRVPTLVKLKKCRYEKAATGTQRFVTLWCHMADAAEFKRLPAAELVKAYKAQNEAFK